MALSYLWNVYYRNDHEYKRSILQVDWCCVDIAYLLFTIIRPGT